MSEALDREALDRLRAKYGSTRDLAPVTEIKPKTGPTPPPVPPVPPVSPVSEEAPALAEVLDEVVAWYGEFIFLENPRDYEILALFTAHTWLIDLQRTTPRLLLDSPVPESGKTTLLEHLERLCLQDPKPAKMGNSVSVAVLARLLRKGTRLLLLDEADRSLSPKNPGTEDRLGILNTGYKKGGEHYVNVPGAGRDWEPEAIPTFAPVVIAGNTTHLPDDTLSRCIEINLLPDPLGEIRDSDWEEIEEEADRLRDRLALAIEANRHRFDEVRQVSLPPGCRARNKERWRPLKQVAALAGNGWEERTDRLIEAEMERKAAAKESGDRAARYWVTLLEHLSEYYRERPGFAPTDSLVPWLVAHSPETWGEESPFGRALTPQRLGRIVSERYKITSQRPDKARGYHENQFLNAWQSLGIRAPNNKPAKPEEPAKPAGEANPLCPTHGKPTLGGLCGRCEAEE
jgi:hypothetical protein